ncbi:hypothetical protein HKD37_05G013131 [Glycine soja]
MFMYCTLETPSELKEVQQGTGIFGIDHRSLPILRDTGRTNKARTTVGARPAAAGHRRTTITSTSATISRVHLSSHTEDGAPDACIHAAFG